jgi:hypothetical protein
MTSKKYCKADIILYGLPEQHFQPALMFFTVVHVKEKEDDKREQANSHSRTQSVKPQVLVTPEKSRRVHSDYKDVIIALMISLTLRFLRLLRHPKSCRITFVNI